MKLDFIRPGKPCENGFIEAFNGRLRDECLNASHEVPTKTYAKPNKNKHWLLSSKRERIKATPVSG